MTKSFSLSVLVPALSALAAIVPLVVWLGFSTLSRQGVSALPAFFTTLVRTLSELLYTANPAVLAGLAGVLTTVGLLMTTTRDRGDRA